jgi:hypothetical protein
MKKCLYRVILEGTMFWMPGIIVGESENKYTLECWNITGSQLVEMDKSYVIIIE